MRTCGAPPGCPSHQPSSARGLAFVQLRVMGKIFYLGDAFPLPALSNLKCTGQFPRGSSGVRTAQPKQGELSSYSEVCEQKVNGELRDR